MSSRMVLALSDLAALVARGLGERVREVTCVRHLAGFRLGLLGLDPHRHLPRCDVVLDLTIAMEGQRLAIAFTVAPATWSAWVLLPGQRLGGGRMVVDPLLDRLGLRSAVDISEDTRVVLDPARIPGLHRLGITVIGAQVDDEPLPGLVLAVTISRNG